MNTTDKSSETQTQPASQLSLHDIIKRVRITLMVKFVEGDTRINEVAKKALAVNANTSNPLVVLEWPDGTTVSTSAPGRALHGYDVYLLYHRAWNAKHAGEQQAAPEGGVL